MRDYPASRRTAIRYWERRRIIYNLALVPPAFFSYGFADVLNWAGDPHEGHYSYVLPLFALSALGANICYSFAYVLEFLFGSNDPTSRWMRYGRTTAFAGGVVFAMFLALIGGRNIAEMDWHHQFQLERTKTVAALGGFTPERVEAAIQAFARDRKASGSAAPTGIALRELISGGYLRAEDVRGLEDKDVTVSLDADEATPQMIWIRVRISDGSVIALLADGSIQELPRR
jgi:hypothetical protein